MYGTYGSHFASRILLKILLGDKKFEPNNDDVWVKPGVKLLRVARMV